MSENQQIPLMRKIIHFLAKDNLTCQVIFVTKKKVDGELDTTLQYMDLTREAIRELISSCQAFVKHREEWEEEQYGKNRDDELIRKYNTEIMANIPNTNRYLRSTDLKAESLGDTELINHLKFIQFRFESNDKTVIFVRKFTPAKILSHGRKLLREISGTLTLTDESIAEMPTDYDFCKYYNDVAIFHPDNFEEFFDYHEIHEKDHKKVFNYLLNKADYEIEDFDEYRAITLEHPQKLRKLPAIEEKQIYLWTFRKIQAFLKVRPMSTVKLDVRNKTIKFKNVFAMMDFYNDAHLTSQATSTNYLARSKSRE